MTEIQKLITNITNINSKIKSDINDNNFNALNKLMSDKNEYISALNRILPSQIAVDDIDNLTALLTLERDLVALVVNKISQLKESKERDKHIINSLTSYLKVTKQLTENLNLKG